MALGRTLAIILWLMCSASHPRAEMCLESVCTRASSLSSSMASLLCRVRD